MRFSLTREHAPATVLMALAVLMLAGAVVVAAVPPAAPSLNQANYDKQAKDQSKKRDQATALFAATAAKIATQTWSQADLQNDKPHELVSNLAAKHGVQIASFRPQKTTDDGNLTQLGYLVNVSGAFPDVVAFDRDIEAHGTRLSVDNVQLGSGNETTDNVSGSLGVNAFMVDQPAVTSSSTAAPKATIKVSKPVLQQPKTKNRQPGDSHVKA